MTVFTRSFLFLWTNLLLGTEPLCAITNPPILTNPSGCGVNLFITEAGCGPANDFEINVTNAPGTQLGHDVYLKELRFIISHEWDADLDIFLKSPSGVIVEVSTDNGDAFDHYGNVNDPTCGGYTSIFSHAAVGACNLPNIKDGTAPFVGSYLPEGNFSDFNDGSSPNGLWTLMICDDGAGNLGHLQFVELVFESTNCVAPTQVIALQEDSTSVLLDWVSGTDCDNVFFEFGPVGFAPGTGAFAGPNGTVMLGGCPPYVFNGLSPNSTYDVYLRENCGSGQFSSNSCPVQVTTTCSPPPPTMVENFNSQQTCQPLCGVSCPITGAWRNASNDNFDWLVNADTTLTINTGPSDDNPGGGKYLYLEASGISCRNGRRAVLVSNCIRVVSNPDSCDLSFDYHFFGIHIGSLTLEISTNGGASWTSLWSAAGNKGQKWNKKFIDLDAYQGLTVQFRFVGRGGTGQFADLALDNIVFYGSQDLGFPSFVQYLDADGDGFGNPELFIASCQAVSFPNYVGNDDDCDDQDADVNPGAVETLCDGIDANCNGDVDEFFVAPVSTIGDTVCSGNEGFVVAFPGNFGQITWFDALTGGQEIGTGDTLYLPANTLINNGLAPIELSFFAEENTTNACVSIERTAAKITILPRPNLFAGSIPSYCAATSFDLSSLNIQDNNEQNGALNFYDNFPLNASNEVGPVVQPEANTTYIAVSETTFGCRDSLQLDYQVLPGPIAHIAAAPTLCKNASKTITASNIGAGTAPISYSWNNSANSASIVIFSDNNIGTVNTYAVTISDANGCTSSDTLMVTTIQNINQIITSSTPVSTCNGTDGSINITPLDGNPNFTYEWSGGTVPNQPGGLTLSNLAQGSYSITVTDSSPEQCRAVVPVVVVNGPAAIVEVESVEHVSCNGGDDGCITLDVIGGPNTSVTWSNGMQGPNVCGLAAGNYSATVTEGNCENIVNIPVGQPEALIVKPETVHVSCHNGNDGMIGLSMFGGTSPLSYLWENGATTDQIDGLSAGFYDLTVTDFNGCEVELIDIPVTQPAPISLASLGFEQPSCNGLSNGNINIEAGGGVGPYSYTWSNGGIGPTLSNLVAGTYTVTIRDQNNCVSSQAINLAQPQPVNTQLVSITPPACAGLSTGAIDIQVSGGTGGYQYSWSNGAASPDLTGVGNGNYAVTVTDENGCKHSASFGPITSPEAFFTSINQNEALCIGRDSNCLNAIVFGGGVPPFSFDWSTDDSGSQLCMLSYGTYTVTATDGNGCQATSTVVIDSIQELVLGFEAFPPLCHGQTGQLAITVAGGTAPYEVVWSNGNIGLVNPGLLAQNHAATVTDALGCANTLDIIPLTEPDVLEVTLENIEGIVCHNGREGAIDISVRGGTMPYRFMWSNGSTTEDLSSIPEGNYSVVVTDDHGCTSMLHNLVVVSPSPLVPSSSLVAPSSNCQTVQVDEICVMVSGGLAPYDFVWDTGATTDCLTDPLPGDYHVTITDAAGCTLEFMSLKVPESYASISLQPTSASSDTICFGDSSGVLNVSIQGGIGPFQFNWSNGLAGLASDAAISNIDLPIGQYQVTVTDNGGCTAVSPILEVVTFSAVTPTFNSNTIENVSCKYGSDGSIPVSVTGGLSPYAYHWEDAQGNILPSNSQTIENLMAGDYFVTVTDQLGCTGSASTEVTEPETSFQLSGVQINNVGCFGQNDGQIIPNYQGGELLYEFNWSNGAFTPSITNLPIGTYSVTTTDANGCQLIDSFTIIGPDGPVTVETLDILDVTCFGASDGSIDIEIEGGTPNYTVNWNNISGEEDLTDAPAGNYVLTIFDSQGCPYTANFTIGTPPLLFLDLSATNQTQVNPPNGGVSATVLGGTPPYSYNWTNGSGAPVQTGLAAGVYGLTVTDSNLCETTQWVEVDLVLGLHENTGNGSVFIHPNPTAGIARLAFPSDVSSDFETKVFNHLGQLVFFKTGCKTSNGSYEVDLTGQVPGFYQLVLLDEMGHVFEGKILVVR